jgi:hypothetical protein
VDQVRDGTGSGGREGPGVDPRWVLRHGGSDVDQVETGVDLGELAQGTGA